MNTNPFFPECLEVPVAAPAPVCMAFELTLAAKSKSDVSPQQPCEAAAGALLTQYFESERLAAAAISEMRRGIADYVNQVAINLLSMPDSEVEMEIKSMNLMAELLTATQRALGQDSGHHHQRSRDDERDGSGDGEDDDGECQAVSRD